MLPNNPKGDKTSELLAHLDHWVGRLTPGSYGSDELLFWLVAKPPREVWDECRATAERKARALNYEDLSVLLLELALEKESEQHLNAHRPGGGGSGSHGRGYQGPRPRQGTTPKNARFMSNVQDLFWCNARDEQGCLLHAPDCDQRDCFVVQGKKQETNTGGKAKLPDHYRCTITCAFCGKRKHYEDEWDRKQRLLAKLGTENGCGKGSGKGNANKDSGKGRSKGNGKGQGGKGKGGRGGSDRKLDKDKKVDQSGWNPNTTPGGNSEPSGGQSNTGTTARSRTQAQQEQGSKRANEDGDQSNARKRSRFMCMPWKLQKKGFEVTCPAGFCPGRSGGPTDPVLWVRVRLGGREYLGVLDTGATISIVAKKTLPHGDLRIIMPTAAIHMGNGHVVHSCGDCGADVLMGSRSIAHRFYVMDTEAFDFVMGANFFVKHSRIPSPTVQAPYLLQVDHGDGWESVPLEQSEHTSSYLRVCKKELSTMMVTSKTDDYQLLRDVLDQGLKELGYSREDLNVELFASDKQHVLDLYCSKGKNCFYKFYWPYLGMAYGNPRFSELGKVLTKVALERSCMVLCSPHWGAHGGNEYWRTPLDKLTLPSIQLPDHAIYVPLGRKTPIGKPGWGSMLSVVDGGLAQCPGKIWTLLWSTKFNVRAAATP